MSVRGGGQGFMIPSLLLLALPLQDDDDRAYFVRAASAKLAGDFDPWGGEEIVVRFRFETPTRTVEGATGEFDFSLPPHELKEFRFGPHWVEAALPKGTESVKVGIEVEDDDSPQSNTQISSSVEPLELSMSAFGGRPQSHVVKLKSYRAPTPKNGQAVTIEGAEITIETVSVRRTRTPDADGRRVLRELREQLRTSVPSERSTAKDLEAYESLLRRLAARAWSESRMSLDTAFRAQASRFHERAGTAARKIHDGLWGKPTEEKVRTLAKEAAGEAKELLALLE